MGAEETSLPRPPAPTTLRDVPGLGGVGLLVLVALLVHLPLLHRDPWNSDEAYLATQAQVLNRGGDLYFDTVDRKPPIVPFVYAAVFRVTGHDDLVPVRLVAVAAWAVAAWLLALEARRRTGDARAGVIAGLLLLGAGASFFPKDGQAADFEVFMLPAVIGSFVLARAGRPLGSGIALGAATLVKQTAALTLAPVAFVLAARRAHPGARGAPAIGWRALGPVALGFAAPIVGAALVFGPGAFLHWVLTGNGGYLDVGGGLGYTASLALRQNAWFLVGHVALVALAAWRWRRWREDADLWLWLAAGIVAVGAGLRFFGHYYLELLPPLCLLAARSLVTASRRVTALVAASIVITIVCFAVPSLVTERSRTQRIGVDLATYARLHTAPGAPILVWGHLPEVYWRSDRPPATRFATTGFLTGQSGGRPADHSGMQYAAAGAWEAFGRDLQRHPPALVFDLAPADVRNSRQAPPVRFPPFRRFLAQRYRAVATVDGVTVYSPR